MAEVDKVDDSNIIRISKYNNGFNNVVTEVTLPSKVVDVLVSLKYALDRAFGMRRPGE